MFHQFQNQFLGFGVGNVENASNNNAMLNHFQANLGIGQRSLLSQMQSNQCATHSVNAPFGQVALLQAQHAAAQFNSTTLPYSPPLLESTAAQRGALAAQHSETFSNSFQRAHGNLAPVGRVQFNQPISSRTAAAGQDQLNTPSLLTQTAAPQVDESARQVDSNISDDDSDNDSAELEESFLPREVQEKVGLIDRCIKSE